MTYICFFLQELMDESATKIPEVRIAAKQCVAIVDGKQFRLKSRNDVNASFIGVATWSVKLVQEMSNLQSVNKYNPKSLTLKNLESAKNFWWPYMIRFCNYEISKFIWDIPPPLYERKKKQNNMYDPI